MQNRQGIGFRVHKIEGKEAVSILFPGKPDEKIESEMAATRKVLGLDPKATEFRVVYGAVSSGDKEIARNTILRSAGTPCHDSRCW